MNKQKIAILGSGLTAKALALALNKLDVDIDLIQEKPGLLAKKASNATLSISDGSLRILEALGIKKNSSIFWPVKKIILYDSLQHAKPDAEFYNQDLKKFLNYIVKKNFLEKEIEKKITKVKIVQQKISHIEDKHFLQKIIFHNGTQQEYHLIIVTEKEHLKLFSNEKKLNWSYSETAYTFLLHHQKINNSCARQFFLSDGPLAFLPLSPQSTSVVWSVKNKSKTENIILDEKQRLEFLQKITLGIYDKMKVISQPESFPLTFNFLSKIALFRTIFVGDITHKIHPIAGQGWNMSLRDIDDLKRILQVKLSKGYDIGSIEVLQEFEKKTKLSNLLFAVSIDLVRRAFRNQSSSIKKIRKKTFSIVSQPALMNKIIDIADKGLRI